MFPDHRLQNNTQLVSNGGKNENDSNLQLLLYFLGVLCFNYNFLTLGGVSIKLASQINDTLSFTSAITY